MLCALVELATIDGGLIHGVEGSVFVASLDGGDGEPGGLGGVES